MPGRARAPGSRSSKSSVSTAASRGVVPSVVTSSSENRRLLDTYARCLRDNQWPAFPGGPHPVSLPAWAIDKE